MHSAWQIGRICCKARNKFLFAWSNFAIYCLSLRSNFNNLSSNSRWFLTLTIGGSDNSARDPTREDREPAQLGIVSAVQMSMEIVFLRWFAILLCISLLCIAKRAFWIANCDAIPLNSTLALYTVIANSSFECDYSCISKPFQTKYSHYTTRQKPWL